jgi:hypothetical protein
VRQWRENRHTHCFGMTLTKAVPSHVFSVGEACPVKAFVEFVSEPIELGPSAFAGVFLCVEQAHP